MTSPTRPAGWASASIPPGPICSGCSTRPESGVSTREPWLQAADYPAIEIDADAKVLWMNDPATKGFRDYGLMIGAGRLRARDRAGNKALQAAIRWAAGATDYMSD